MASFFYLKRMKNKVFGFYLIVIILLAYSCRSTVPVSHKAYIQSKEANKQKAIRHLLDKTYKTYGAADYQNYFFAYEEQVADKDLKKISLKEFRTKTTTESALGTSTHIHTQNNKMVFLSCYHTFHFPDTIKQYYLNEKGYPTPYLAHLRIKSKQIQFAKKNGYTFLLDIMAKDKTHDIAFLVGKSPEKYALQSSMYFIPPKAYPAGQESIICGFPAGYHMTTTAMISKPNPEDPEFILLDANFDKGYSGAPFLIYHATCDCYRIGGIITSAASETKNILIPEYEGHERKYNANIPYNENAFVHHDKRIRPGITFTTTAEKIKEIYFQNKYLLEEKDVNLECVFTPKKP